jgi:Arc/MetJ family transcription regulator
MRTTIDLDEELHAEAVARARSERRSLSDVVNDALRSALRPIAPASQDQLTGLGVIDLGRRVTSSEVSDVLDD